MAQDQYSTPQKLYVAFSDTSFVTGDSPVTHDVNATLLRNGVDGFIDNFGAGDLQYQISEDGTTFGSTVYLPAGARDSVSPSDPSF